MSQSLPKYMLLDENSEQIRDKRIMPSTDYIQEADSVITNKNKKITNTFPLSCKLNNSNSIFNLQYSSKYGLMLLATDGQVMVKNIKQLENDLVKGEQNKNTSLSIKFSGELFLSPDQEILAICSQSFIQFVRMANLAITDKFQVPAIVNSNQSNHYMWVDDRHFLGWKFQGKAVLLTIDPRTLGLVSQAQLPVDQCTGASIIHNHLFLISKLKVTIFNPFEGEPIIRFQIDLTTDQHGDCPVFEYSYMIDIFKTNISSNSFTAEDIFGLVLVYYDDQEEMPDQRYITFIKGDIFNKQSLVYRAQQNFYSTKTSRQLFYNDGQKASFKLKRVIVSGFICIMIERSEKVYIIDPYQTFENLNIYDIKSKHELKHEGGKFLKGMAVMENMLQIEKKIPSEPSQLVSIIVNKFGGQFMSLYFKDKETNMTIQFPGSILAVSDDLFYRRYAISSYGGIEDDDNKDIEKKMQSIKKSKFIKEIRKNIDRKGVSIERKIDERIPKDNKDNRSVGNLFGGKAQNEKTTTNLFGGIDQNKTQKTGGNLFGEKAQNEKTTVNLFGGIDQNKTQKTGGNLFGGKSQNEKTTVNLFGGIGQNKTQKTGGNLFGGKSQNEKATVNLFGGVDQNKTQKTGGNLFGGKSQNEKVTVSNSVNLFGAKIQAQKPTINLFGGFNTGPSTSTALFGAKSDADKPIVDIFPKDKNEAPTTNALLGVKSHADRLKEVYIEATSPPSLTNNVKATSPNHKKDNKSSNSLGSLFGSQSQLLTSLPKNQQAIKLNPKDNNLLKAELKLPEFSAVSMSTSTKNQLKQQEPSFKLSPVANTPSISTNLNIPKEGQVQPQKSIPSLQNNKLNLSQSKTSLPLQSNKPQINHSLQSNKKPVQPQLPQNSLNEAEVKQKQAATAQLEKSKAAQIEKAKAVQIEKAKAAQIERVKAAQIEKAKAVQIEKAKAAQIEKVKAAQIEKVKALQIEKAKAAQIERVKAAEIEKVKALQIEKAKATQIERVKAAEIEKAKKARQGLFKNILSKVQQFSTWHKSSKDKVFTANTDGTTIQKLSQFCDRQERSLKNIDETIFEGSLEILTSLITPLTNNSLKLQQIKLQKQQQFQSSLGEKLQQYEQISMKMINYLNLLSRKKSSMKASMSQGSKAEKNINRIIQEKYQEISNLQKSSIQMMQQVQKIAQDKAKGKNKLRNKKKLMFDFNDLEDQEENIEQQTNVHSQKYSFYQKTNPQVKVSVIRLDQFKDPPKIRLKNIQSLKIQRPNMSNLRAGQTKPPAQTQSQLPTQTKSPSPATQVNKPPTTSFTDKIPPGPSKKVLIPTIPQQPKQQDEKEADSQIVDSGEQELAPPTTKRQISSVQPTQIKGIKPSSPATSLSTSTSLFSNLAVGEGDKPKGSLFGIAPSQGKLPQNKTSPFNNPSKSIDKKAEQKAPTTNLSGIQGKQALNTTIKAPTGQNKNSLSSTPSAISSIFGINNLQNSLGGKKQEKKESLPNISTKPTVVTENIPKQSQKKEVASIFAGVQKKDETKKAEEPKQNASKTTNPTAASLFGTSANSTLFSAGPSLFGNSKDSKPANDIKSVQKPSNTGGGVLGSNNNAGGVFGKTSTGGLLGGGGFLGSLNSGQSKQQPQAATVNKSGQEKKETSNQSPIPKVSPTQLNRLPSQSLQKPKITDPSTLPLSSQPPKNTNEPLSNPSQANKTEISTTVQQQKVGQVPSNTPSNTTFMGNSFGVNNIAPTSHSQSTFGSGNNRFMQGNTQNQQNKPSFDPNAMKFGGFGGNSQKSFASFTGSQGNFLQKNDTTQNPPQGNAFQTQSSLFSSNTASTPAFNSTNSFNNQATTNNQNQNIQSNNFLQPSGGNNFQNTGNNSGGNAFQNNSGNTGGNAFQNNANTAFSANNGFLNNNQVNNNQNAFNNSPSTNVFGNSVNNTNPFGNNPMQGGSFGNNNNNPLGNGQNTGNAFNNPNTAFNNSNNNSGNAFSSIAGNNNTFLQKPANPISIPQGNVNPHLFQPRK